MTRHVIVDGSNLATEGRMMPSLSQLSDAVQAFIEDNPDDLISVVVDATFGHRIDTAEVPEFEAAIEHNELVAPPAGAVGRGDAFVLAIANKVGATILSNDSFQEFHGVYDWLFDEGRLIGGKPVPHVGWVFVPRLPVRGPLSRKSVREAGAKNSRPRGGASRSVSKVASGPLPVPKSPPPGARLTSVPAPVDEPGTEVAAASATAARPSGRTGSSSRPSVSVTQGRSQPADQKAAGHPADQKAARQPKPDAETAERPAGKPKSDPTNDLMTFLGFVEKHPIGSSVNAVVDSYSSHGAYVKVGDIVAYLPLRLMSSPPPRSARDVVKLGDAVTLAVSSYQAQRRSIELCMPALAPTVVPEEVTAVKPRKRGGASKAATSTVVVEAADVSSVETPDESLAPAVDASTASTKRPSRRRTPAPAAGSPAAEASASPVQPSPSPASTAAAGDDRGATSSETGGLVVVKPAQRGRGGRGRRPEVLAPAITSAVPQLETSQPETSPPVTVELDDAPPTSPGRSTQRAKRGTARPVAADSSVAAREPRKRADAQRTATVPAESGIAAPPQPGTLPADPASADPAALGVPAKKQAGSRRGTAPTPAPAAAPTPSAAGPTPDGGAPSTAGSRTRKRAAAPAPASPAAPTAVAPPSAPAAPVAKAAKRTAKRAAPAPVADPAPAAAAAVAEPSPVAAKRGRKKASA